MPCGKSVAMDEVFGACPRCGSYQLQPTGGTEMRVREIEIE
ncbi:MAG: hydrogenase/urease maturation nickel metallochaperone HypA [Candidatus Dechloromonas phosphoritropha]